MRFSHEKSHRLSCYCEKCRCRLKNKSEIRKHLHKKHTLFCLFPIVYIVRKDQTKTNHQYLDKPIALIINVASHLLKAQFLSDPKFRVKLSF